jgi:5-hydroxyisourate hydrolase-like protein (transthyretin family)
MMVVVKVTLHKSDEDIKIEKTKTGWTNQEGKVTFVFTDVEYYFEGPATITCGTGVFSKKEKLETKLYGKDQKILFQRSE